MRTTLTLDEDVAAKLKGEARRSGKPFKAVVNETLREGFAVRQALKKQRPFRVKARSLGLRPGLDYDNIGVLLEQIEGPLHK
ncbi:MAG: DUF2191 domain-containing protein [Thermoanaerobaculia bacterium]